MDVIHAYARPRKRRDANCANCQFAEVIQTLSGEKALLCKQRLYDDKALKCYLPKEGDNHEHS